jgi:hypothetical protein
LIGPIFDASDSKQGRYDEETKAGAEVGTVNPICLAFSRSSPDFDHGSNAIVGRVKVQVHAVSKVASRADLLPRSRWQVTIGHAKSLEALKKSVRLDGDESPGRSGLRSVCWKVSSGS